MRVAIVTEYWKESPGGGIKVFLANLVEELQARAVDVRVLFRVGSDPEQIGLPVNPKLFALKAFLALQQIQPDAVHVHGADGHTLFPAIVHKKTSGCRVVQTFHTEPETPLSPRFRFFYQRLLDNCDAVTFVSHRLKERVGEVWGLKHPNPQITYAGAPRSVSFSDGEVRKFVTRFRIGGRSPVLLALGLTALSYKAEGLKVLMQAVKLLREEYPGILLIATREGVFSQPLKEYAEREGLTGSVLFTGDVDNSFVPLAIADIYTHITLGDGLPIALLEAMAMGKPIVATPVAGIPEAIRSGMNGILVPPEPRRVAAAIADLLEHPDTAAILGRNAKQAAEDVFTWKKSADRFLALYNDSS
ncbi:MAG: glycosyltransferase family 4 protein [Methanomicrobiales archaeon]|nr:glycosyltransferase family 4 protein [Methanomicrobiales archaeon]